MGLFAYIYYQAFISAAAVSVASILHQVSLLSVEDQHVVFLELSKMAVNK